MYDWKTHATALQLNHAFAQKEGAFADCWVGRDHQS